jgi:hypothetical protein
MAADMPVAMIENASLPHQRECRSDLRRWRKMPRFGSRARPFWSSAGGGLCNVFSVGAASRWWPIKTPDLPIAWLHQIAGKEKPGLSRAFLELQLIT